MFRHVRSALVAFLVALFVLSYAVPALAAPSAWSFVDVQLHMEDGQPRLVVSGDLPEDVPLPYEAELAVPSGTQLEWIGEILGGPPAEDPPLQYVVKTVGDMDIYTFTLTKSRTAQFEGVSTGMTGTTGETQNTTIKWTAWQDLPSVRVSQRLPRGTQVIQASDGASMQPGDETYSYYSKTVTNVKAGDVVDLTFSYTLPTSAPSQGSSQSSTDVIVTVFMGAAVLLLLGILVVSLRQKPTTRSPEPAAQAAPQERAPAQTKERTNMKLSPKHWIWLVGALAIAAFLVYQTVAETPGKRTQDGQIATKIISATKGDATAVFDITLGSDGDPAHEADHIFDSIQSQAIDRASFDASTLQLEVQYDSASITEGDIRQMLAAAGYVALAASDGVAATVSADGKSQQLAVTPGERLEPNLMTAKAGLPLTITFGAGSAHLASVKIESLGVELNIEQGGTLELPALQPGTYELLCAEGYADGTLLVE